MPIGIAILLSTLAGLVIVALSTVATLFCLFTLHIVGRIVQVGWWHLSYRLFHRTTEGA